MDDGVCGAAESEDSGNRVVEGGLAQNIAGLQIFPNHLDNAAAGIVRHLRMIRIDRGNRASAGQREAENLRQAGHRRGRAHRHARPRGTRNAIFDFGPSLQIDVSGAPLGPILRDVGAAAEDFAAPIAAEHRPRRNINRRQVHTDSAHQERRRGFVAAAHQHAAVRRIRTQQLFGLHRQQIAVHHRGRFLKRFAECEGGHLDGKSAGLPYAFLDVFRPRAKMAMARIDIAPRVDDRDDRLSRVVSLRASHRCGTRTVTE